jgi:hypothetical protein
MIDSLKELGLDPELCYVQSEMLTGLGGAYLAEAESAENGDEVQLLSLAAATNYRRAASNCLLVDRPDDARKFFSQVALAYERAGAPYAAFIANLGSESLWFKQGESSSDPGEVFVLWTNQALESKDESRRLRRRVEPFRTRPVGLLGLEVGVYLDLFDAAISDASSNQLGESSSQIAESLLSIASAYALCVRRARQDRYHWRRLAMPFHPVEPDVLSLLVALDRRLARNQRAVAPLIQRMPIGEDSLGLLRGALEQLGAWRDDKEDLFLKA